MKKALLILTVLLLELVLTGTVPERAYAETNISINSPDYVAVESDFTVTVDVTEVTDFVTGQFDVSFDDSVLKLEPPGMGLIGTTDIPASLGQTSQGTYKLTVGGQDNPGISGSGYLAALHFHVKDNATGSSFLVISNGSLTDSHTNEMPVPRLESSVTVYEPLAITTVSIPDGTIGITYSAALEATGGNGSYGWSVSSGTLPDGFSLDPTGDISGTPTTAGNYNFTVQVTDGTMIDSKAYSINVLKTNDTDNSTNTDDSATVIHHVVTASAPATVEAEDNKLLIDFPQGAVTDDTSIVIKDEILAFPWVLSGFKAGDTQYDIEAISNGAPLTNLAKEITVRVRYSDEDVTAADDDPGLLVLGYYDEDSSQWIELHTIVDTEEQTLTATTGHLGKLMVIVKEKNSDTPLLIWIVSFGLLSVPVGAVVLGRRRALLALQLVSRVSTTGTSTRFE